MTRRLGVDYGTVRLAVDEAGEWALAYEELAASLRVTLGQDAIAIEHVGSTAVPGLPAKPILDIAVGLTPTADIHNVAERLTERGYIFRGDKGEEGGVLFVFENRPLQRVAHVHAVRYGEAQWRRYLAFRDLLRGGKDLGMTYFLT